MPAERVIDAIRTLARDPDPRTDGELVRRFATARDEDAFAELLRRHGPTVFGVCRRVLGRSHDAEDAFQAVWVVFARRAGDVQPPGSVGHFLYGVAVRTATKARTMAAKRRLRDLANADRSKPEPKQPDPELAAILDDELSRLPDKYRAAVVLCDVNGKTRSLAAAELGWPEGTVADRVRKGRELLAARLRARGVALSAAVLATALAQTATAAPSRLTTVVLAATFGGGSVPPSALLLAEGVMRTMSAARWKLPMALLLTCGLVAGVGLANRPDGAEPEKPAAKEAYVPANKEEAPAPLPLVEQWKEASVLRQTGWLPGSVAYSPDGKVLVVGGTDGKVAAYDDATQKKLWEVKLDATFSAVAFSPDGEELAATFKNGVKLLDPKSGQERDGGTVEETGSSPQAVGFLNDNLTAGLTDYRVRTVVFSNAHGSFVKLWFQRPAAGGGIQVQALAAEKQPADRYAVPLAVNPAENTNHAVMTGPIDPKTNKNVLWAYSCGRRGGNKLLEGHNATVVCAAWSGDGKTIVTGDTDGVVIVWNAATFKEKSRVGLDRRVAAVAVTKNGSHVAAAVVASEQREGAGGPAYWEQIHVWQTKDAPKRPDALKATNDKALGGPFSGMAGLAFSPDGKSLAAGFANFTHLARTGQLVGKVRIWTLGDPPAKPAEEAKPEKADQQKWEQKAILRDHATAVDAVAVTPNGKEFASIGGDGLVRIWDAAALTALAKHPMSDRGPAHLSYSPDGKALLVASPSGVRVYDAATGKEGTVRKGKSLMASFSPDGKWIAHSDGRELQVIHADGSLGIVAERTGDPRSAGPWVAALGWSPDGERLAVATNDESHSVSVWSPKDGPSASLIGHPEPVLVVAWSKDGKAVATGDAGGMLILWNGVTLKELRRVQLGGRGGRGTVCSLAFTPDGKTLAIGMLNDEGKGVERVVFLDVATGDQVGFVQTYEIGVPYSLVYTPDGKRLIVCGRPSMNGANTNSGIGVWDRVESK